MVSPAIVGSIIAKHGTDDQKETFVRPIAAGTKKIAFAITEPDAGTNSHNISTTLTRENGKFLLSGQKVFISGVEDAEHVAVVARGKLDDGQLGLPSFCIVDVDAPGFTRQEIPMVNQGADKQWTLFFDKVELEEDRLIGGYNGGLGAIFDGLNPERIMGSALALGAAGTRWKRQLSTRASAPSGRRRSAPTRAWRIRSRRRRSSSSSRG